MKMQPFAIYMTCLSLMAALLPSWHSPHRRAVPAQSELILCVSFGLSTCRGVPQERLLDYAASVDPHSRPTAVKKLVPEVQYTPRQNPVPAGFDPLAPPEHQPPVPDYKVRLRLLLPTEPRPPAYALSLIAQWVRARLSPYEQRRVCKLFQHCPEYGRTMRIPFCFHLVAGLANDSTRA